MRKRFELLAWMGHRIGKPPGWERIVRLLAPPKRWVGVPELGLVRDGIVFLAQPALPLGWNIVMFGSYEPELRDVFRKVLHPGTVAIDAGANVGWHTLLMAQLVGGDGRVLAVEANPSVRANLVENLQLNDFRQVEVVGCALAEAERTLAFYAPSGDNPDSGNGHVMEASAGLRADTVSVEARPLDAVVAEAGLARVDLIKVDVEGYEWPVLQGAAQTLARFRPHVVFEFDAAYTSRGGGGAAAIGDFFRNHRYRLFAVGRNWLEPLRDGAWPAYANIWAIPMADACIQSSPPAQVGQLNGI